MIDRLHKPLAGTDLVSVTVNQMVQMEPGIPSFADDGYVANHIGHGWHVMVKDPTGKDNNVLDHAYLVNQKTGQQEMLKFSIVKPTRYIVVKLEDLDTFRDIEDNFVQPGRQPDGTFYICLSTDGGFKLDWTCVDERSRQVPTGITLYVLVGGAMVQYDYLWDHRLSWYWTTETSGLPFPPEAELEQVRAKVTAMMTDRGPDA